MGEKHGWLFEPTFNRSIKLRQADTRISDNAGALLLRELDHRLGFTADLAAELYDPRDRTRTRYTQTELLRQHIYALALGHVHQDDHDTLAHDPAVRLAVWDRPSRRVLEERLASQPSDWPAERMSAAALLEHYRKRGTFEDRLGELSACVGNGLSANAFEANEASLLLKLLAFNLAGMIRGELEDSSGAGWDLKRVQRTVLRAGAKVARRSRRLLVDVSRAVGALWGRVLERVARWWRDASWGRDHAGRRRGPRRRRWVLPPSHAHLSVVLRE